MTESQRNAINSPAEGLMVYQTDNDKGLYHYDGSAWKGGSDQSNWSTADNDANGSVDALYNSNLNLGIGTNNPGHNSGAAKYLTISSGSGSPGLNDGTALELIGGTSSGSLQNRIDFIARATDGNNYTTGRIEMTASNDVSGATKYGIMKFHTGGDNSLNESMSIDNYGKITFGNGDNSYEFPISRGSHGQVLSLSHSTDGLLEWTTPSDGSSAWTVSGNDISNSNSGNIGIGTSSPQSKLHIDDASGSSVTVTTDWGLKMQHYNADWGFFATKTYLNKAWDGTKGDFLYLGSSGNRANSEQSAIFMTQNSGISLGSGKDNASALTDEWFNVSSSGMYINATTPTYGYNVGGSSKASSKYEESGSDKYIKWNIGGSNKMKLDGNGKLEITSLKITGNPGADKVLTSDGDGNATWQTPAATGNSGSGSDAKTFIYISDGF
jgi:hypothetical protein